MKKELSKTASWLLKHALTVGICALIVTLGTIFLAYSSPGTTTIGENITTDNLTATGTIASGTISEEGTLLSNKYLSLPASPAQGEILYYDGTNWTKLAVGESGYVLKTQGASQNPVWAEVEDPNAWCNGISGWHFYTTNGRGACWSKTLADSVSWNKSVDGLDDCSSDDCTASSGAYTCVSSSTLAERMAAASVGEWYKIVESVGGYTIATDGTEDGQDGAQYISVLAIADCIDGTHDLGAGTDSGTLIDGCQADTGSWSACSTTLRSWAGASDKSALPYLATKEETSQTDNDYWDACSQNDGYDIPLACSPDKTFYRNEKVCDVSDQSYSWAAAVGYTNGDLWESDARNLGVDSCSYQSFSPSSITSDVLSFRVVVRP